MQQFPWLWKECPRLLPGHLIQCDNSRRRDLQTTWPPLKRRELPQQSDRDTPDLVRRLSPNGMFQRMSMSLKQELYCPDSDKGDLLVPIEPRSDKGDLPVPIEPPPEKWSTDCRESYRDFINGNTYIWLVSLSSSKWFKLKWVWHWFLRVSGVINEGQTSYQYSGERQYQALTLTKDPAYIPGAESLKTALA